MICLGSIVAYTCVMATGAVTAAVFRLTLRDFVVSQAVKAKFVTFNDFHAFLLVNNRLAVGGCVGVSTINTRVSFPILSMLLLLSVCIG